MKIINSGNAESVNLQRRKIMQGVGAVAAVTIAGSALGGSLESSVTGSAKLSGRVISQIDSPVKTLILRNESDSPVAIEHFLNGGLIFDGELLDCNGACIDGPVNLSSGKEILVQFDKRHLFNHDAKSKTYLNVQSSVHRMSAGTRVVEILGSARNGVVTLTPAGDVMHS